jgi:restriction endonuclease
MPTQSSAHFFLNWTKERIDEMDATLASLESKVAEMGAESRVKADQFISDLRQKRTEFVNTVKKQGEEGGAAWETIKARLESQWRSFEIEIDRYFATFDRDVRQQQAVFQSQVTAQMNAWRETADERTSTRPCRG